MKRIPLFMALIVCLLFPFQGAIAEGSIPAGRLTIKEAQRLALDNNPDIRQALAAIRSAEALLSQAYSAWWPQISANGGYFRKYADIQPDWQPDISVVKRFNELNGGLEVNWLLFNGFARRSQTLAAKYGVEQTHRVKENTERLLLEAVATAFYQSQLAQEKMRIAEQNSAFNRSLEKNALIRYKVGSAPKSEMLNFSVRALQAESDFIEAERAFTVACSVLAELMGLPDADLKEDLYPAPVDQNVQETIPSYAEQVDIALHHRPDLLALESAIGAARAEKNAKKGAWAPTIGLTAGVNYLKQTDIHPVQEEVTAYGGVGVSWDLFTGGRRSAEFQQKKADQLAIEEKKHRKELEIQSAIRQALANASAAKETWKRQDKACEMTLKIRNDIEKLYTTGSADLTRLNEAQTDLVRAQGLGASSLIQFRLALEKLRSESGLTPDVSMSDPWRGESER
ncbi:MAG: hypothetical protein C1942_01895 [Prosthecochloris sp.]|uniref:TolC family protein n=1 Tax=Prosthecochloris sp. TaxID=290513 RepID=UPI0013CABBF4|nr:TolC family protein [Prosthecochloris sp.]NEX11440.1 hypothetical protein [Prosthecochloris sp.]